MGSQRITSKVSNSGIFTLSPLKDTLQAKYATLTTKIKERFDTLGVTYSGVAQTGGLVSASQTPPSGGWGAYFYHSDHLGSSSLITDLNGEIVQHLEYVPFGGTFIDERRTANSWHTPFLFSGKERDVETGLLYVSQRYQDEKYGIWYSVDQMAEKYPNISSYVYCANNPVKYVDPDGRNPLVWWAVRRAGIGAIVDIAVQVASEWIQGGGTFSDAWDRLEIDVFQVVRSAGENLVKGKYTSAALSGAGDMISYILSNDDWTWEGAFLAVGEGGLSSLLGDKLAGELLKKIKIKNGVIFSADLSHTKGKTRSAHRNTANKQLQEAMDSDPNTKELIELYDSEAYDKVSNNVKSGNKTATRKNPKDTEWDHNNKNKYQIDLRTKNNHTNKTAKDPERKGGYFLHYKD